MTRYCVFLSGGTYEVRSSEAAVAYCPNGNSAFLVCDALNAREKPTLDRAAGSADPARVAALASAVRALGSLGRVTDAADLAVALVREAKALAEVGSTK